MSDGGMRAALTSYSRGAGCGCKLSSAELNAALSSMTVSVPTSPSVAVGVGTSDDAGVFLLSDDVALVQTLDFFTPIVDDAFTWGRIAATNALSDVYAMGGRPVTAMNIVGWPRDVLPWELLGQVLDGAATVLAEAGCALVGGHSIDDAEPKFGVSVTGLVHPDRCLVNSAGKVGDVIVLTKPLGVGILTTAVKRGLAGPESEQLAVDWMLISNRAASTAAVTAGVKCATDVTGFGFVGHLTEVLRASHLDAEIDVAAVPIIEDVLRLVDQGALPGGTQRNADNTSHVDWTGIEPKCRFVLCDAQTSGGLLMTMSTEIAASLTASLPTAVAVGRLTESRDPGQSRIRFTS